MPSLCRPPRGRTSLQTGRRLECFPRRKPPHCSSWSGTSPSGARCPGSAEAEATETFPRDVFRTLGRAGLLGASLPRGVRRRRPALRGLPPGGRGDRQPSGRASGSGVSVHALSCFGLRTRRHRRTAGAWLPGHARRRAARCLLPVRAARRVRPGGDDAPVRGATATTTSSTATKAWITHGGHADFYKVMARTSDDRNGHLLLPRARRRRPG